MRLHSLVFTAAVFSACTLGARAAEQPARLVAPSPAPADPAPAQTDQDLAGEAGGQEAAVAMTEQDLTAINTGNRITANTVGSGNISLQGSALSGFNGIGNFTMNTGQNNNLQSSLSVTIIVTK